MLRSLLHMHGPNTGVKNSELQKIRSLPKIRAVNNSTLKAHSNPLFSKLKVLNLDDTYKLCVHHFIQIFIQLKKQEIIQITNHNLLCSLDLPDQSCFDWLAHNKRRRMVNK